MTSNDNTAPQLLLFPIQKATNEEMKGCDDASVHYYQTRLAITNFLNLVMAGEREATDELREDVQLFNKLCRELGFKPLSTNF